MSGRHKGAEVVTVRALQRKLAMEDVHIAAGRCLGGGVFLRLLIFLLTLDFAPRPQRVQLPSPLYTCPAWIGWTIRPPPSVRLHFRQRPATAMLRYAA